MSRIVTLAVCAFLAFSPAALAGPLVVEKTRLAFSTADGDYDLETLIVRPEGPGPFPVVVISHGGSSESEERKSITLDGYRWPAEEFASRGYLVVFPLRAGYGTSRGHIIERRTSCRLEDSVSAGEIFVRQFKALIGTISKRPDVDAARVVAIGHSFGGYGAIALGADNFPGVRAVLNFAGGTGYRGDDCKLEATTRALERYGSASRVPTLWVYVKNDLALEVPDLGQKYFAAYSGAGGKGELVLVTAFGTEGHSYFVYGVPQWRAAVGRFLAQAGLPFGNGVSQFSSSDFPAFWTQAAEDMESSCVIGMSGLRTDARQACRSILRCVGDHIVRAGTPQLYNAAYRAAIDDSDEPELNKVLDACKT